MPWKGSEKELNFVVYRKSFDAFFSVIPGTGTEAVCRASKLWQLPENLQITLNEPQSHETRSQQHARPETHAQTVPEISYCSCF